MNDILVPTDFSENACKAAKYAAGIAERSGGKIYLVHALTLLGETIQEGGSLRESYNAQVVEGGKVELYRQREALNSVFPGVAIECRLFRGPVQEVLIQFIREQPIDLVVMGTQGASGIIGMAFGSVTSSFIGHCPVAVLAVPREYSGHPPANLALATQLFDQDNRLLSPVFSLAALYNANIHVFAFDYQNYMDRDDGENKSKLDKYLNFLRKSFPLAHVSGSQYYGDSFIGALDDYSSKNNPGIICMFMHKRGFWQEVFNPSRTKAMACQSHVPLLAVPVG